MSNFAGKVSKVITADRQLLSLILRQLHRKVGELEEEVDAQVRELEVVQLEELSEALLNFEHMGDLTEQVASDLMHTMT